MRYVLMVACFLTLTGFANTTDLSLRERFGLVSEKSDGFFEEESKGAVSSKNAEAIYQEFMALAKDASPNTPLYFSSLWKALAMTFYMDREDSVEKSVELIEKIWLEDRFIHDFFMTIISRSIPEHIEWNLQEEIMTIEELLRLQQEDEEDFQFGFRQIAYQIVRAIKEKMSEKN